MPALPVAFGFAMGIVAAEWGYGWICAAIAAAAFAALYCLRHHYAAFIAISAAAGALLAIAREPVPLPEASTESLATCSGLLITESIGENAQRCVVRIDSINSAKCKEPFKCALYNRHITPGLLPGARVGFRAELKPIEAKNDIPYEADYGKYLKYDGITAQAVIYNESLALTGEPNLWHRIVNTVRESMAYGISRSGADPATSAFLLTTILGEDDFLAPDIKSGFRSAGLSHILALSGMHVGIITSFMVILLFPLRLLPGGRKWQSCITIILVWAYAVATGLSPSVTRAAVMLSVLTLAHILERGNFSFNSLCVALIVVLAINPYSLFTPGLQMSFCAVCSILLAVRLIPRNLSSRPVLAFLLGLAIVPIAAMLGTGIICAYYFHSIPLLFLPANIAIALIFPLLLAVGITLMLLGMAGWRVAWLASIANFLYGIVIDIADAFANANPWGGIFFSAWSIAPYWIGLVLISEYLHRRFSEKYDYDRKRRAILIWGTTFFLIAAAIGISLQKHAPKAELRMPDIYPQCLVIVTPEHAMLLPIGKNIDQDDAIERYNSRYSAFLMHRGHEQFEIAPDSFTSGPFHRNGQFIAAGDRLIHIIAADTVKPAPVKPFRILVGSGWNGAISEIADRGDTVIFCKGLNGRRAAYLRSQLADTIIEAATLTISFE